MLVRFHLPSFFSDLRPKSEAEDSLLEDKSSSDSDTDAARMLSRAFIADGLEALMSAKKKIHGP
jgi:hypothetical protein